MKGGGRLSQLTDDMKSYIDMPTTIFHSEKESNDRRTDCAHHRMVEHLHCKAPLRSENLLIDGLFGNVGAVVACVAVDDICDFISTFCDGGINDLKEPHDRRTLLQSTGGSLNERAYLHSYIVNV